MNLNVELITGDVNKVDGIDFLLIGHKNPLREQIRKETGSFFKTVDSESWIFPHQYELLTVPSYKWKQVAAIKFRANGKIDETQFARISSPITTALRKPQMKSIGILPPTWRNPEYCALGVIYSLWIVGYAVTSAANWSGPDLASELFPNPTNKKFKIISQTGTEYFEEVLKNDCDLMWKFVERLGQQRKDDLFGIPTITIKKNTVIFNISKILI